MHEWNRVFRPATAAQVRRFENRIGFSLPPRYKNYLLTTNGGEPTEYCGFVLPGIEEPVMLGVLYGVSGKRGDALTLENAMTDYGEDLPEGFLPIGEDPGGNLVLVATSGEQADNIFYWDRDGSFESHQAEQVIRLAPDIDTFLESLRDVS